MIAGSTNERRHLFVRCEGGAAKNSDSEVIREMRNCGEKQQVISAEREDAVWE